MNLNTIFFRNLILKSTFWKDWPNPIFLSNTEKSSFQMNWPNTNCFSKNTSLKSYFDKNTSKISSFLEAWPSRLEVLVVIEMEVYPHHFAPLTWDSFLPISDAAVRHANWDASKVRDKLHRDIEAHASSVRNDKLSNLKATYEVSFLVQKIHCWCLAKISLVVDFVYFGSFYYFFNKSIILEDACLSQILFDRNKSQLHLLNP